MKNDAWIAKKALEGMIDPFQGSQTYWPVIRQRRLSYGLSSYGYDIRLSNRYKMLVPDPKGFPLNPMVDMSNVFTDYVGDYCVIPAHGFVLGCSFEHFKMPRDVMGLCLGKSTYARCGIIVNVTPIEPEWEGQITIEISNTTPTPVQVYSFAGIAQIIFLEAEELCETSYADRAGKYQGQKGVTLP